MEMSTQPGFEFEDGDYVDDDVFFAEIRRQILILTADNEDFAETNSRNSSSGVAKRRLNYPVVDCHSPIAWWESKHTNYSVPASLAKLWESSNGTGVFIPKVVHSRRHQMPRSMNNSRRTYKRIETRHS